MSISRFEIEAALLEIPGLRIGLAVPFDNRFAGEEVGAFVVPHVGVHLSAEQVIEQCRARLGFEKCPKVIVFGKEAPQAATDEYDRTALKRLFARWKDTRFIP
jgi:long-chain acyl-CoA synthetase